MMDDLEFKKTKKTVSFNVILFFILMIIMGVSISILELKLSFFIDEFQGYLIILIIFGTLLGYATSFMAKILKVRPKKIAIITIFLAMILVVYFRFGIIASLLINKHNIYGYRFFRLQPASYFYPTYILRLLLSSSENYSIGDGLQGIALSTFWIIESIVLILITIFIGSRNANRPFDEETKEWLVPKSYNVFLQPLKMISRTQILKAIESHNVDFFKKLMMTPYQNYSQYSMLYFYKNSEDKNSGIILIKTYYLNVENNRTIVVLSPHDAGVSFVNELDNEFRMFEMNLLNEND